MSENQQKETSQRLEMLISLDPENKIVMLTVFKEMKCELKICVRNKKL